MRTIPMWQQDNAKPSIFGRKGFWRVIVLAVIVISLLGPWVFDRLYVPAEYPCSKPTLRLEGDFCGYPVSGFQAFLFLFGGLFNIILEGVQGNFAGRGRELLFILLAMLFLLPYISTSVAIWNNDSRRWQTINLIAWGSACLPLLFYMIPLSQSRAQLLPIWGLWVYGFTVVGTIILEVISLIPDRKL